MKPKRQPLDRYRTPLETLEPRRLLSVTLPDDVNATQSPNSDLTWLTDTNGTLLFADNDGLHGPELFKSNGTADSTSMVLDINPAYGVGSGPRFFRNVHGTVYFNADDGQHGRELWKSDGTPAGTVMVKDLITGLTGANPFDFAAGPGNTMLFLTNATGGRQLWSTDGTAAGTVASGFIDETNGKLLVGDVGMGGKLYYFVYNGSGTDMWSFDGGPDGPHIVASFGLGSFADFTVLNDRTIVFTGGVGGRTLWKSDGTTEGTSIISGYGSKPYIQASAGSNLFFTVDGGVAGSQVWGWNGTSTPQLLGGPLIAGSTSLNGVLYYLGADNAFWRSDATPAGTQRIDGFGSAPGATIGAPRGLSSVGGRIYFSTTDSTSGTARIYSTDGTAAGTSLIKTLATVKNSAPGAFTGSGNLVYFIANQPDSGNELWVTDGTDPGTFLLKDVYAVTNPSVPSFIGTFNNRLYFFANDGVHGSEPWSTDGSPGSAVLLKDLNPGTAHGSVDLTTTAGIATSKYLYFPGWDGATAARYELWRTDGTTAGTILLKGFNLGSATSWGIVNDTLYFTPADTKLAKGIWTTDGTPEGTVPVPGTSSITSIAATMDGVLYCVGNDSVYGKELWRSDGTSDGTYRLTDLNPGAANSFPVALTPVNHTLFFFAEDDATQANHLFTYTTDAGVRLVQKIGAGPDYAQSAVATLGGKFYFRSYNTTVGNELWVSDGTDAGTHPAVDLFPGPTSTVPDQIFAVNNTLVFTAKYTTYGSRFYRSDGTPGGTYLLGDMIPSPSPRPNLANFCLVGNYAYFAATRNGVEAIWRTDGTVAGTTMVADMPANLSYNAAQFAALNGNLLFNGNDPVKGKEVWKYTPDPPLTAPTASFSPDQGLKFQFDRPLANTPSRVPFNLYRILQFGQTPITPANTRWFVDAPAGVVTLTFPGFPNGILPDGNYRITLPAGIVSDATGNALPTDFTFDFFVLAGDANRDRSVNFNDLVPLAQNYNTTGKAFADGDFNGDGAVDFNDLVILAQRYNTTLASPAAPVGAPPESALLSVAPTLDDLPSSGKRIQQPAAKQVLKPSSKPAPKPAPLPPSRRKSLFAVSRVK